MEPRIQYAKTEDGVSIAYWTLGEGTPFVMIPTVPFSHVQLEWKMPAYARWYEHHARKKLLLRYDPRGVGLSQKNVTDFSLEAQLRDLVAVVDRADLPRFALWAWGSYCGPIGVTYAARFPERVTRLVLFSPALTGVLTPALDVMREENWEMYLKTVAHMVMGWPEGDIAREIGAIMAEAVTPKTAAAMGDALKDFDITPLLSDVSAPTLVITRRQGPTPLDAVTSVAARLPNARLVVLEGDSLAFIDDPEVVTAVDEFLGESDEAFAAPAVPAGLVTGLATILFTDMEASTALRRKLGDAKVQELLRAHNEIVRAALKTSGGSEIKHTGDGIMASFSTATSALQCGIDIQRGVASHVEEHPDAQLGVYVGLNAGEPIAEDDPDGRTDLFGTSVDLARRICDHAEPGQILASNVVRELAEGKGFLFGDIGDVVPKGFEEPVRLYEVRWQKES